VILFLNGEVWGAYSLYENIDREYLERRFGEGDYELIKDGTEAVCGNTENWTRTLDFFEKRDLTIPENYAEAARLVDIDNLIDFWMINIFSAKWDWPHENIYCFRRQNPPMPWKWINWDSEQAFSLPNLNHNTLAWAVRDQLRRDLTPAGLEDTAEMLQSTRVVRSLLKNSEFRQQFITRFCDLQNSILLPERLNPKLEAIVNGYSEFIETDIKRWRLPDDRPLKNLQAIRNFITQRPQIIRSNFREYFQARPGSTDCAFLRSPQCRPYPDHSITPDNYPWSGTYFDKARITLDAKPNEGFTFVRWDISTLSRASTTSLVLNSDAKITALFGV